MHKILIELTDQEYEGLQAKKGALKWRDILFKGAELLMPESILTKRDLEFRLGSFMQQIDKKLFDTIEAFKHT